MSRVESLGRGAISQSAAAAAAASGTSLKRLFANVVEQAKEGAAKKEGKLKPSSEFHLLLDLKLSALLSYFKHCVLVLQAGVMVNLVEWRQLCFVSQFF